MANTSNLTIDFAKTNEFTYGGVTLIYDEDSKNATLSIGQGSGVDPVEITLEKDDATIVAAFIQLGQNDDGASLTTMATMVGASTEESFKERLSKLRGKLEEHPIGTIGGKPVTAANLLVHILFDPDEKKPYCFNRMLAGVFQDSPVKPAGVIDRHELT